MAYNEAKPLTKKRKLTADLIYGFSEAFLKKRFDNPHPTPGFHPEIWDLFCEDIPQAAVAAPRGHAKSTAVTHAFTLACTLFRVKRYVLIVSDTESQACEFLGDIKRELLENEDLAASFGVKKFVTDKETDVVVELEDGWQFRILARGSEQKIRGRKWRGTRPDLILCDDLENDEIVMNDDRRAKFRRWVYSALLPAGSDNCWIRVVGTILHLDSFLARICVNEETQGAQITPLKIVSPPNTTVWKSIFWRAHPSLHDFSQILWPSKFNKERLLSIREVYIQDGFPEGYSQEYLNRPIDDDSAFFRPEDLKPILRSDEYLEYYATADLAITEKKKSANTVIAVGGLSNKGILKIVDVRILMTSDSNVIIDELISVYNRYKPKSFGIEDENIKKAIGAPLVKECEIQDCDLPYVIMPLSPDIDKIRRARSFQYMTRTGKVEFDQTSSWWEQVKQQLVYFPRSSRKDIVDALSWLGIMLSDMQHVPSNEDLQINELLDELHNSYDYEQDIEEYIGQHEDEAIELLKKYYAPANGGVGFYTGY